MMHLVCKIVNSREVRNNEDGSFQLPSKDVPKVFFPNLAQAKEFAKELAKKSPTVQYAVLSVAAVYETKEPEIMTKVINEVGELVAEKP